MHHHNLTSLKTRWTPGRVIFNRLGCSRLLKNKISKSLWAVRFPSRCAFKEGNSIFHEQGPKTKWRVLFKACCNCCCRDYKGQPRVHGKRCTHLTSTFIKTSSSKLPLFPRALLQRPSAFHTSLLFYSPLSNPLHFCLRVFHAPLWLRICPIFAREQDAAHCSYCSFLSEDPFFICSRKTLWAF